MIKLILDRRKSKTRLKTTNPKKTVKTAFSIANDSYEETNPFKENNNDFDV